MRFLCPLLLSGLLAVSLALASAQPYQPDGRTLLLDHLDETFKTDGTQLTKPDVLKATGDMTGGRPGKGGEFAPGKFGNGLQLHGLMSLDYPAQGNIDLSAGSLDFWVALDFDTAVVKKNPGKLSNQMFWTLRGPGRVQASVYSTLGNTAFAVIDKDGQLVLHGNFPGDWKKGEWHHLELRWGKQMELWCDGEQKVAKEWSGLFGPLDVKPDDLRMNFGSQIGWGTVESEFMLDEIRIQGPGGDQQPDRPLFTMPRLTQPPVIDGTLGTYEWSKAARITGFVGLNDNALVEDQTVVYGGWDNEALYFAFECLDPQNRAIVTRATGRDGQPYQDDAVDILLQPNPDQPYYHLVSNAAGALYDSRSNPANPASFDTTFNPNWTVKTSQQPGRWVLECKIPFKELDGRAAPKDGERWRINFARDAESGGRLSSWSFASGSFHRTANFGEVMFSNSDRALRMSPLSDQARGKVEGNIALTGLSFDPLVTVQVKLSGSDAKAIVESQNRLADYRAVNIKSPTLVTGTYTLAVRASTANGDLYYQRLPFRVIKPYDVSVAGYPYEGKLWVTSNVAGLGEGSKGVVARSELTQGDKVVSTCEAKEFERGIGNAAIDITDLAPGKYVVKSSAVAPDGKVLATAEADFEQFAKPSWWRSTAGLDHSVPPPWHPVKLTNGNLDILGRQYRTGTGLLPQQVVVKGESILAGPVTLQMKSGAASADLARLTAKPGESFPDAIMRSGSGTVGPVKVELKTRTEFDGMQICDLTLTPNGTADIDSLSLEIPLKSQYARFILPSTGGSSTAAKVGKEPWRSSFVPQVWVGNDDLGYGWFAESDQFWSPRDDQMLEVADEGERTVLRCKMIRNKLTLKQPATITFGLMATPVKDAHAGDPFLYRFGSAYGDKTPVEYLRYPGPGDVDPKAGTLEFWLAPGKDANNITRQVASIKGQGGGLEITSQSGPAPRIDLIVTRGEKKEQVSAQDLKLAPGEFAHVAVTWGEKAELFVNGKSYGTTFGLPAELAADPEKLKINLGTADGYYDDTNVTVDEVRISKVNRYPAAFTPATAPFAVDADTLLLDHLDVPFRPDGEDAETRAEKISGTGGELGGVPSIGSRFVTGKFGQAVYMPPRSPLPPIQFVKQEGADASLMWVWHEDSGEEMGWPPPLLLPSKRTNLREIVKESNDAGLRIAPYTAYPAIGAPSQLASQFGHEWARMPLSTMPYEPPKGHYMWDMCGQSGFADYIGAGTAWILDEYGFVSCYTDGITNISPCQNFHHGCGYRDENGVVHSTYPVFATREMAKRMYRAIKSRNKDGYLVHHQSFSTNIATLAFGDMNYSGEHEQYEDLLKFRTRWQGTPLGIWPILLGSSKHFYEPMHLTYSLLHGRSVMPQGLFDRNDMFRKTANIWQAYDKFGYREAEWIPYYRAETGLAKPANGDVKVSLYRKPGKSSLLVIGNLTHKVTDTTVNLDFKALGLAGKTATNVLDGRSLPLNGNSLSVHLRPVSFLLVEVQ